jgi:hypothetical protein
MARRFATFVMNCLVVSMPDYELVPIVLLGIDFYFLPLILDRGCGVLNTRMCIDIIV